MDWQTFVTLAMGLVALAYLARRWWPAVRALVSGGGAARRAHGSNCGTADAKASSPSSSCGDGCGQCSRNTVAPKHEHAIHWAQRPSR